MPEKTKYKYIYFVESKLDKINKNNKKGWECKNNKTNSTLAYIVWYPRWKEWIFTQAESGVIFNDGCLNDVVDFIRQLKEK